MNNEEKIKKHKKIFKWFTKYVIAGSIGGGIGVVFLIYFIGLAIGGPKDLSIESIGFMIGIAAVLYLMVYIPGLIIHLLIIRRYKNKE